MGSKHLRIGAASEVITSVITATRKEYEKLDDLYVKALYVEHPQDGVLCLLSYDLCEITRMDACALRQTIAATLSCPFDRVHVYCTHMHSPVTSVMDSNMLNILSEFSRNAAIQAQQSASCVEEAQFLRLDTGTQFNINRRTRNGNLGVFCLMQSQGCVDNGTFVDGSGWVRSQMQSYGVPRDYVEKIQGPYPADRPNDPYLDVVLFRRPDGSYAGGISRFTAHPVVCSAGFWKKNVGRDYPGILCDKLSDHFKCQFMFLQGPAGDHRPRHRDVGPAECRRIGLGLAEAVISHWNQALPLPLNALRVYQRHVPCRLRRDLPKNREEAAERQVNLEKELNRLHQSPKKDDYLKQCKMLTEQISYIGCSSSCLGYLEPDEIQSLQVQLPVSMIKLGPIRILNMPGELFSSLLKDIRPPPAEPTTLVSFADGVVGYLMPEEDFAEGGYEFTNAIVDPASFPALKQTIQTLLYST